MGSTSGTVFEEVQSSLLEGHTDTLLAPAVFTQSSNGYGNHHANTSTRFSSGCSQETDSALGIF
jgi:cation transporter-like permease